MFAAQAHLFINQLDGQFRLLPQEWVAVQKILGVDSIRAVPSGNQLVGQCGDQRSTILRTRGSRHHSISIRRHSDATRGPVASFYSRDLTRQVSKDAADATGMQAGFAGNLARRQPAPLEQQDGSIIRRAQVPEPLPQLPRFGHLAWSRLRARREVVKRLIGLARLVGENELVLANAVQETVTGHLHKKCPQLIGVGEAPARCAKAFEQIAPCGLDDVERIELRPQAGGQEAAHDLAQVWFILVKDLRGCSCIAAAQFFEETVQG
jgi:hypothetical protein